MNSQNPSLQNISPQTTGAQDPLAQLQDIHLPAEIGIWPPAWGWWVLSIFILISLYMLIFFIKRKRSRNTYRALAAAELSKIQTAYSHEQNSEYLQALSVLLRRTALSGFGSHFNASLKGNEWLVWLDAQCAKTKQQFSLGVGQALLIGPYQKSPDFNRNELHQLSLLWIKEHRNQWQMSAKQNMSEAANHA
jgi:hypothetical protein